MYRKLSIPVCYIIIRGVVVPNFYFTLILIIIYRPLIKVKLYWPMSTMMYYFPTSASEEENNK